MNLRVLWTGVLTAALGFTCGLARAGDPIEPGVDSASPPVPPCELSAAHVEIRILSRADVRPQMAAQLQREFAYDTGSELWTQIPQHLWESTDPKLNYLNRYWVLRDPFTLKIIGGGGVIGFPLPEPREKAWLNWFYIEKEFRGRGYGKILFDWILMNAKLLGVTDMNIYTSDIEEERPAHRLYLSRGFQFYERFEDHSQDGREYYARLLHKAL